MANAGEDEGKLALNDVAAHANKRKLAVLAIIKDYIADVKSIVLNQPGVVPQNSPDMLVMKLVSEMHTLAHHRMYFSSRIEYLHATQLARMENYTTSGEKASRLEDQLAAAHEYRERQLNSRDQVIQSFKEQMSHLDHEGETQVRTCREDTLSKMEEVRGSRRLLLDDLRQNLKEDVNTMSHHEFDHEEEELEHRRRRKELEAEIQVQIRRYDVTMSGHQLQLDNLQEEDHHCDLLLQHKLAELEELEIQYLMIEEERKKKEEERVAAMQLEFRREHAARIIQRAWGHFKMKKMLKKAQKKRKKKAKEK